MQQLLTLFQFHVNKHSKPGSFPYQKQPINHFQFCKAIDFHNIASWNMLQNYYIYILIGPGPPMPPAENHNHQQKLFLNPINCQSQPSRQRSNTQLTSHQAAPEPNQRLWLAIRRLSWSRTDQSCLHYLVIIITNELDSLWVGFYSAFLLYTSPVERMAKLHRLIVTLFIIWSKILFWPTANAQKFFLHVWSGLKNLLKGGNLAAQSI